MQTVWRNIGVLLQNNSDKDFEVKRGDKIAQYCYVKIAQTNTKVITREQGFSMPTDSNRTGGYGSTDKA